MLSNQTTMIFGSLAGLRSFADAELLELCDHGPKISTVDGPTGSTTYELQLSINPEKLTDLLRVRYTRERLNEEMARRAAGKSDLVGFHSDRLEMAEAALGLSRKK